MADASHHRDDEVALRAIISGWRKAVEARDLDGIVRHYTEDTVLFDAIPPYRTIGRTAIRKLWADCLPCFPEHFSTEHRDLVIETSGDLGVMHGLFRFIPDDPAHPAGQSFMRVSVSYRRNGDSWDVVHEHVSMPFNPMNGKVATIPTDGSDPDAGARPPSAVERSEAMGIHRVTPHLVCKGAAEAIEFYKAAFGATEMFRLPGPDGRLVHASMQVNGSSIMIVDEFAEMGGTAPTSLGGSPVTMHLTVDDADAAAARFVAAGGTVVMPVADQFWGDRYGLVRDPFGHFWSLATPGETMLSPEEIARRMAETAPQCGPAA